MSFDTFEACSIPRSTDRYNRFSSVDTQESETGDVGDVDNVKTEDIEEVSTVLGAISHVLYDTHKYDPYTKISVVMNIANILLYIFDYVMDIMVVYWLHQEEKADENVWTWVVLTLVLIFVPLVVVNVFSIVRYHEDHKVSLTVEMFPNMLLEVHDGGFCPAPAERSFREKMILICSHLLLVGPVVRQCQVLKIGLQEISQGTGPGSKEYLQLYMKRKYYERDLAYLTMIGKPTSSL